MKLISIPTGALMFAPLMWTQAVHAQPGIFFGRGLGDLPDSLSWLRPFAITGAIVDEVPLGIGGMALAPNLPMRSFDSVFVPADINVLRLL